MIIGAVYTKFIREFLIVEPLFQGAPAEELIGNHVYFLRNVKDLLWDNFFRLTIVETLLIYIAGFLILYNLRRLKDSNLKGAFIIVAFFASIMVLGEINESRMLIPLVPMYAFFWLSLKHPQES